MDKTSALNKIQFITSIKFLHVRHRGGMQWHSGWGTALQTRRSQDWFPMVSLEFFIDLILPAALWPWGRLSLYHKWVPGIIRGASTSWNPQGLSRPVTGLLYLCGTGVPSSGGFRTKQCNTNNTLVLVLHCRCSKMTWITLSLSWDEIFSDHLRSRMFVCVLCIEHEQLWTIS
jgi:hypothetical protein